MIYQNLVDEVMNELYKRLEENVVLAGNKKKVVLVGNQSPENYKILESMYEVVPYGQGIKDFQCIVICNMPIDMLANLALGCGQQPVETFILEALLAEKSVFIVESGLQYREYKKSGYNSLYALYDEYEKKIIQFGIKSIAHIIDLLNPQENSTKITTNRNIKVIENKIISSNKPNKINNYQKGNSSAVCPVVNIDLTYKKLLLESDLVKLHTKGLTTVEVKNDCIITPLAADFVRTHNLVIQRE